MRHLLTKKRHFKLAPLVCIIKNTPPNFLNFLEITPPWKSDLAHYCSKPYTILNEEYLSAGIINAFNY